MVGAPNTLDAITSALQTYVVAPLNAFGIAGFLFDAQDEDMSLLTADITDHYTEDNKAIQDHIAIRPARVTLRGFVGEVTFNTAPGAGSNPGRAVKKLTQISAFLPQLSRAATQMKEAIDTPSLSSFSLNDAANIYGTVKNVFSSNGSTARQSDAYRYFEACMNQGVLMGIQTPWKFMTSMAIESVVAIQGGESMFISDFSVTFKQIRIAKTLTTAFSTNAGGTSAPPLVARSLQEVAGVQAQAPVNIGNCPAVGLPTNLLPGDQSRLTGATDMHVLKGIGNLFQLQ